MSKTGARCMDKTRHPLRMIWSALVVRHMMRFALPTCWLTAGQDLSTVVSQKCANNEGFGVQGLGMW